MNRIFAFLALTAGLSAAAHTALPEDRDQQLRNTYRSEAAVQNCVLWGYQTDIQVRCADGTVWERLSDGSYMFVYTDR